MAENLMVGNTGSAPDDYVVQLMSRKIDLGRYQSAWSSPGAVIFAYERS